MLRYRVLKMMKKIVEQDKHQRENFIDDVAQGEYEDPNKPINFDEEPPGDLAVSDSSDKTDSEKIKKIDMQFI